MMLWFGLLLYIGQEVTEIAEYVIPSEGFNSGLFIMGMSCFVIWTHGTVNKIDYGCKCLLLHVKLVSDLNVECV